MADFLAFWSNPSLEKTTSSQKFNIFFQLSHLWKFIRLSDPMIKKIFLSLFLDFKYFNNLILLEDLILASKYFNSIFLLFFKIILHFLILSFNDR